MAVWSRMSGFLEDHRDAGDPLVLARRYEAQQADELVFYDITATHEGRQLMLDVAARVAEQVMMPLTVGGGVTSLADFRRLLLAGADKISLNSAAVKMPELVRGGQRPPRSAVRDAQH